MTRPWNLFRNVPTELPDELIAALLDSAGIRIERIVSHGHASPEGFWYDQGQHEWVVVLRGAARLRFEDGELEMRPGDSANIPAHARHRVEWTTPDEPTIWLAVHYGGWCASRSLSVWPEAWQDRFQEHRERRQP